MKHLLYIISLVTLVVALYLIITQAESGRSMLIAGILTGVGLLTNLAAYVLLATRKGVVTRKQVQ